MKYLKKFLAKINRQFIKLYVFIFARPSNQQLNNYIFQLALKGKGYNNCCDPETTGELKLINLIARFNPKLCIDVGANKGEYSKLLLLKTNATIVSFEPMFESFKSLISLQKLYPDRFYPINKGVSSENGELEINYGEKDSMLASFSLEVNKIDYLKTNNINSRKVPVISLDTYYEENLSQKFKTLDLLKIDTEGFEYEVLKGAKKILEIIKPKFIQVEFNWHQLFRGHSLNKIAEMIENYKIYQLLPHGTGLVERDVKKPEANIYHYSNFVFVREDIIINL